VVLHSGDIALACGLAGEVRVDDMHGLFVGDTRVLSTYRLMVGGQEWELLGRNREGHGSATFTFQNPLMRGARGELPPGTLFLTLRRRVAGALHDDLTIRGYADHTIETRLSLQLDADFADVFEVKDRRLPPRLDVVRQGDGEHLTLKYERAGFRRALEVQIVTSDTGRQPSFVGSEITFDLLLEPKGEWTCCIHAEVVLDGVTQPFVGDPHDPEPAAMPDSSGEKVYAVRDQSADAPIARSCRRMTPPVSATNASVRFTNASRPRSKRVLPSLASSFSTTFCVAMPAWSVPGTHSVLKPRMRW